MYAKINPKIAQEKTLSHAPGRPQSQSANSKRLPSEHASYLVSS
jgi:hypothetical protein